MILFNKGQYLKQHATKLILISVMLAIIAGIYLPELCISIKFLGDIFINLLKLFALPLIISALIASIGSMGQNMGQLKILARNIITYMLLSEIIAVTIALVLFNILQPGVGVNPDLITHQAAYTVSSHQELNLSNFLLSIFPDNIFDSLTKFELLPVVAFSIMFGIGCSLVGDKAQSVLTLFSSIRDITNTCLQGVMRLAPIGIFALISNSIAISYQNGSLINDMHALLTFVTVLIIGLLLHVLWQLIFVVITTKQSPLRVFIDSIPVFLSAFATSSSVASLPIAIETANKLKANAEVTKLMLPLCASINIGGMMMYEVAAALFFSQVLGIHLSIGYQILLAIACILGGMAEGGIPETSLVSLVVVFKIVNVPLSAISILLPLDRILDRIRTMANIFGNMCGTIIVSHFLNKKNINNSSDSR